MFISIVFLKELILFLMKLAFFSFLWKLWELCYGAFFLKITLTLEKYKIFVLNVN